MRAHTSCFTEFVSNTNINRLRIDVFTKRVLRVVWYNLRIRQLEIKNRNICTTTRYARKCFAEQSGILKGRGIELAARKIS